MKKTLLLLWAVSLLHAKEETQLAQILHISQNTMTYQEAQRYCSKLAPGNKYRIIGDSELEELPFPYDQKLSFLGKKSFWTSSVEGYDKLIGYKTYEGYKSVATGKEKNYALCKKSNEL